MGSSSGSVGEGGFGDGGDGAVDSGESDGSDAESPGIEASTEGAAPGPSCAASGDGLTNCGAAGESCCTSLAVPGGTYYRTYYASYTDAGPLGLADPATVSAFRLDKYDVTVGRFRTFVSAVLPVDGGPGWRPSAGSGKHVHLNGGQGLSNSGSAGTYETGWATADDGKVAPTTSNLTTGCQDPSSATWTDSAGSREALPINCMNWWEAYSFCIWDGGFLPSEAEWELAAAGGDEQRLYPWGSMAPGTSSQYAIYGCLYPGGSGSCTGVTNIAPVGSATLGAGRWGQLDLAGNVWQWTLDFNRLPCNDLVNPCVDCAYLVAGPAREIRGGTFAWDESNLLPSLRLYFDGPTFRTDAKGFRCARPP